MSNTPIDDERYMTRAELDDFIRLQANNPTPQVPGSGFAPVAAHTPKDIDKLPDDQLKEYSPTPTGDYKVRIYGKEIGKDKWVAKLAFEGQSWHPNLVGVLEAMDLYYDEYSHSMVAHDIEVIRDTLKLATYRVGLARNRDTLNPPRWPFRDMLTWEFTKLGHPLEGFHLVTSYIWCVH